MIVIGLTGSIGMGKSTAADMLRDAGYPVHCSDKAVHELLAKGGDGVAAVRAAFPGAYDAQNDAIDRRAMVKILGKDNALWDRLQDILHPLVRQKQDEFLAAERAKGTTLAVLDIPLLFETGAEKRVDYTICVTAPAEVQKARVMARPGVTEDDFAFRLSRQMPDADKRAKADFIVFTDTGFDDTRKALQKVTETVITKKGKGPGGPLQNTPSPSCG